MNLLDMRTVLSSYGISSLISVAVMASLWAQHRRRSPELAYWLADFIMQFLGLLLIVLRGNLPDFFSIVLSNTLIIGGTLVLLIGLERYYGKSNRQGYNYIYLGLFFVIQMIFLYVQPSLQWRTINISVGIMVLCGQCVWLLIRRVDPVLRPAARPAVIVFGLFSLVSLVRIYVDLVVPQGNDVFKSGLYDTLVILTYQMLFIGLTFALVLMVNRRMNMALENDIMERKLAEAALKVSEEKFSVAFHNSPDAFVISSLPAGEIVDANESFFTITGFTREETLGKTTIEMKLWDNLEQRNEFVNALQKEHRALNFEAKFRKKLGELFTGLISAETIQLQSQTCVLSVIHDITERNQVEAALSKTEHIYRQAITRAGGVPYQLNYGSENYAFMGEGFESLTGYPPAEMSGPLFTSRLRQIESFGEYEDLPHEQHVSLARQGELTEWREDYLFERKDGTLVWLADHSMQIQDLGGKTIGSLGILMDITGRKQTEEALRQAKEYAENLIQTANVMVVGLDSAGNVTVFNETAQKISGFTSAEMEGRNWFEVLVPKDRYPDVWKEFSRLSEGGMPKTFENPILTKSGKERQIAWQNSELHEQGKISGSISFGIDITDHKVSEQALHKSEAELRALFASMHDLVLVIDHLGVYREIAPTDPALLVKPAEELLGKTLQNVFPPEQAVRFLGVVQRVLSTQQTAQIEYDLIIGGQTVRFESSISPMTEDSTLWVVHDITKRKRFESVKNAIFRITQAAITTDGMDALYHSIHSILGELITVENFYIALLDPASNLISFPYYIDQYDEPPTGMTQVQGLTGYVIRTGRPLLATREVFERLVAQGEVEPVGAVGVDWMGAPLKAEGRMIGVMAVQSYSEGIHFAKEDLNLLEFVSTQVAQAIERKRLEEEIRNLSLTDALTGLYNRRGFTLLAEQAEKLAHRTKKSMLLFFGDVDDLKTINDTYGHDQGDLALQDVSALLKKSFREADIIARFGGDEFVALAVDASMERADVLTNRIQDALKRRSQQGDRPYQLSISLGIAHYDPEAPSSLAELISEADARMYEQKQARQLKS